MLGGMSGALAATATMPLDVAKTSLQCGGGSSIGQVFRDLVREKGIAGLYAGMVSPNHSYSTHDASQMLEHSITAISREDFSCVCLQYRTGVMLY